MANGSFFAKSKKANALLAPRFSHGDIGLFKSLLPVLESKLAVARHDVRGRVAFSDVSHGPIPSAPFEVDTGDLYMRTRIRDWHARATIVASLGK